MTNTMSSMAEIVRVGGWGLRGLGYPYGVAERAVPMLAWTEAALGGGMRSIRLAEPAILASYEALRLRTDVGEDGCRHLQAHNRHLIEVGPPAVDLITVDVRRRGRGSLALSGAIGSIFVPALANLLARRGLAGAAVYRDERSLKLFRIAFGPGYVGQPTELVDANLPRRGRPNPAHFAWLEASWNEHVDAASTAKSNYCGFVVWTGNDALPLDDGGNLVARVQKAWTDGIETALEDINYLYQLEMRAWAPTSERSRLQAGYGKF